MLHHVIKCAYKNCGEIFDKAKFPRKQYCSRRCQSLALYQLEQHTELIRTVDAVNKLGSGTVSYTHLLDTGLDEHLAQR